jgi:hypothetical protein
MTKSSIKYNVEFESKNRFEYYGIKKVYDLAQNEPHKYYLYMHGKGMMNKHGEKTTRTKINVFLTQETLRPWRKVIDIFKQDNQHDIVALFPSIYKWGWFNFWWASGKFLNRCKTPKISDNRYYYETWLKSGRPKKMYNLLEGNYKKYEEKEILNKEIYKIIKKTRRLRSNHRTKKN